MYTAIVHFMVFESFYDLISSYNYNYSFNTNTKMLTSKSYLGSAENNRHRKAEMSVLFKVDERTLLFISPDASRLPPSDEWVL